MNYRRWQFLLMVGLMGVVVFMPLPAAAAPQTHHFMIDSQQFEFDPSRIKVNEGDRVIIDFTASDVMHGFYLDGYEIDEQVAPGITKRIEFTADKSGKFRYRCSVSCGSLHPFMIGELVVGPNSMLWRGVGIVFVGLLGVLLYLWYSKGDQYESQKSFA
jgi:heme/copper-type cytochrome/quinol oxidase subunit 2